LQVQKDLLHKSRFTIARNSEVLTNALNFIPKGSGTKRLGTVCRENDLVLTEMLINTRFENLDSNLPGITCSTWLSLNFLFEDALTLIIY
jgi:hypothetical protein